MSYNILIVDDSRTIRSVVRRTIELASIPVGEVFEAENGQEALDILNEEWVDLVLADINMPVMTGVEMVDRMQEDEVLKSVPVVIVSTEGSVTRIEELRGKGVKGYVRKPFTPEQLKDIVDGTTELD